MAKINILDKHTAELIAAGEVVERPSSVVKETVENSIDAGASKITVEIQNGGISFIRVTDNGCGIAREDVHTAFLPHATSKIAADSDLESIITLGFRGEALASVASVARVSMLTKQACDQIGTNYTIEGGQQLLCEDAGCPDGTTLVIRDLFYNTPARMKFLKKNVSEANSVADVMDRLALSHPEISFRLIRDGKETLFTPGDGKLMSAVRAVFGREFASGLIPVEYEYEGVKIGGYISKPLASRSNRSMQIFYINGRFVKTATGSAALMRAYENSIMAGKFPACVLHINFPPSYVDVNVHPAKIEVRFSNEKLIFDAVYYGAKTALSKGDTRPEFVFPEEAKKQNPFEKIYSPLAAKPKPFSQLHINPAPARSVNTQKPAVSSEHVMNDTGSVYNRGLKRERLIDIIVDEPCEVAKAPEIEIVNPPETKIPVQKSQPEINLGETEAIVKGAGEIVKKANGTIENTDESTENTDGITKNADDFTKSTEATTNNTEETRVSLVGEAFGTYIIAQVSNRLLVIDKHAAHERIIFDRLVDSHTKSDAQMLLSPVTLNLRKQECALILDNASALSDFGIIVEDFGGGAVIVRSLPMLFETCDAQGLIEEIAEQIKTRGKISTEKSDWIYHSIACRAAVKAHDKLSDEELLSLAKKIAADEKYRYCPHGRPVAVWITRRELEKQFGRLQ